MKNWDDLRYFLSAARSYLARFECPPSVDELDWVLWDKNVSN